MKLIGKGWQYRVYDLGNGRVRKIERNFLDSYGRALCSKYSETRFRPIKSIAEVQRIKLVTRECIQNLKTILVTVPPRLLGNITFIEAAGYEQDKATTLGDYFKTHIVEQNKKAITKYTELVTEFWKFRVGEEIFNFTLNTGIDAKGEVLQLDIAEFVFDKETMANAVRAKKWLGQSSYLLLQGVELKDFYRSEMKRLITLETLEKNWGLEAEI